MKYTVTFRWRSSASCLWHHSSSSGHNGLIWHFSAETLSFCCQMAEFLTLSPSGWRHLGHSRSWVGGGVSLGVVLPFFLLPLRFSYLPGRPSWMCLFDVAHFEFLIEIFKNFCNVFCLTLQLELRGEVQALSKSGHVPQACKNES